MHTLVHTPWADLEIFLAVAERGSFSKAARTLGVTQPTVSRRIMALEERLGRPLFRRDVEGTHLTDEARQLLPLAEQMARWARELDHEVDRFDGKLAGAVRLAAPPGVAFEMLVPLARDLRRDVPGLRLELIAGIEHIDLSRGEAELALRSRRPTQPDLMVALVARASIGVFASADYKARLQARHAGPLGPADIDWVTWAAPYEHLPPRPELLAMIPGFQPAFASNDYLVQERAVALGLGAMILPRVTNPDASHPAFVELDITLPLPTVEYVLVCAKSMRQVPRVAVVIEALRQRLAAMEGLTLEERQ